MSTSSPAAAVASPCPHCGAAVADGDVFCEACGQDLPSPATAAAPVMSQVAAVGASEPAATPTNLCVSCGAVDQIAPDGYCGVCGFKQPPAHDHEEHVIDGAAAVTDRGRHHHRNEDAVAISRRFDGRIVAVVCDGVSMTVNPDAASAAAVEAARATLTSADVTGERGVGDALLAAHVAARAAVQAVAFMPDKDLGAPSCTFLAAVITPPSAIDIASLGDCRAYWFDGASNAVTVLTADDSWAAAEVVSHEMSPSEAYADPRAHMITRWVGLDADPSWKPTLSHFDVDRGHLLLCSDGLWNYAAVPEDLPSPEGDETLIGFARRLVEFANDNGGHDNITVVIVDLPVASA